MQKLKILSHDGPPYILKKHLELELNANRPTLMCTLTDDTLGLLQVFKLGAGLPPVHQVSYGKVELSTIITKHLSD